MYIAFKWLVGLSIAMWLAMCGLQIIVKKYPKIKMTPEANSHLKHSKNLTMSKPKRMSVKVVNPKSMVSFYYLVITIGALSLSILNKKIKMLITKSILLNKHRIGLHFDGIKDFLKDPAHSIRVAIIKYFMELMSFCRRIVHLVINLFHVCYLMKSNQIKCSSIIYYVLAKQWKEFNEERKVLKRLLMMALNENKRIRMQYQLQVMAKDRLKRYNEDYQKQIKEDRWKWLNLQQIYWVTQQGNVFLKTLLQKLQRDKKESDLNYFLITNEVYKSSDDNLKSYCRNFLKVRNVSGDSNKIDLKQSISQRLNTNQNNTLEKRKKSSWVHQDNAITRISGQYFWTVKDENGMIEKLYDYNYCPSGDESSEVVHKIRQYSVYHDKDCFLDFSKSKMMGRSYSDISDHSEFRAINNRFLTDSDAFNNFLKNNQNVTVPVNNSSQISIL